MTDLASTIEVIRRAAGVLYQRLEVATAGPWREAVGGVYGAVVSDAEPHDDGYGGRLIAESMRPADREYLVTMQPDVTRQVAEWLVACADLYSHKYAFLQQSPLNCAERIAAAILEASGEAMPGDPLAHLPEADR